MPLSLSPVQEAQLEIFSRRLASAGGVRRGTRIAVGRGAILRLRDALVELCQRCGEPGMMDHLEYFLTLETSLRKTPYLVLVGATELPPSVSLEDVLGFLLVYEYTVMGMGTGIFATDDTTGRRTVIAGPGNRLAVARLAAEALLRVGARVVVQSMKELGNEACGAGNTAAETGGADVGIVYATRLREIPSYLPIEGSFDATVARLGQHTRRNLRYYRRRAEAQLGAVFAERVEISRDAFEAFNRECTYAVPTETARRRYAAVEGMQGMFLCGVKDRDGRWLSMIAGRRYGDTVEVDWQMNRAHLEAYSLSTAMRAFFIEHEARRGTKKMYLEGGTPHAMRYSFAPERVRDLAVRRRIGPGWMEALLLQGARRVLPKANFALEMLVGERLHWRSWPRRVV